MNASGERTELRVRHILNEHWHKKICYPVEDLAKAIEDTCVNIDGKIRLYKWSGMILLVAIPVISASLSVLLSNQTLTQVKYLSYFLTLLTLLNSIFKPRERFKALCSIGIAVHELRDAFLAELEMLPPPIEEGQLHALVGKFSKDLAPYQQRLIDLFFPETAVEGTKKPKGEVTREPMTGAEGAKKPKRGVTRESMTGVEGAKRPKGEVTKEPQSVL